MFIRALIFLVGALTLPVRADFEEQHARDEVAGRSDIYLHMHRYADLNQLAEQYRVTGARSPSGAPLLAYFYRGVSLYGGGMAVGPNGRPDDTKWKTVMNAVKEWTQKAPSPAAFISVARLYIDWGGQHRGEGLGREVNPAEWAPFFDKIHAARLVLEQSKVQASIDPEWYRMMLRIAKLEGWKPDEREALYKEALTRFPHYEELYFEMADAEQPKWGGSWAKFDAVARLAARKNKPAEGSALLARVYVMTEPGCGCSILDESTVRWSQLKDGFASLVHLYPTQWNISGFAYFACMAKDRQTTKALMEQLREYSADTWNNRNDYHQRCMTWAFGGGKAPDNT